MATPVGKPRLVPYSVYIDESFYEFWGLLNPQGNFCYAAIGLPTSAIPLLAELHVEFLRDFQAAVSAELGERPPEELKSTVFRRLPFAVRRRLGLRLREFMHHAGAFVLADFTEVRGFVLERIRSDLAREGHDCLPEQWEPLYEKRQAEIIDLVRQGEAGQGPLLEWLLGTTVAGLAHYMVSRARTYHVYFDPRETREDQGVRKGILTFTQMTLQREHREEPGRFAGVSGEQRSEALPGLQIADLMVGEVRNWFVSNREILRFASGPELVTAASANMIFKHETTLANPISGQLFSAKRQRIQKLPVGLARRLRIAHENSILPFFRNLLAKNLLSCVADWGEFRHIDFADGTVIDSLDDWEAALLL